MSEGLDNISAPVEKEDMAVASGTSGRDMAAPTEELSATSESTSIIDNPDVATQLNVNANNDILTTTAQQAYQETYGGGGDESHAPVTEMGRQKQDEEKEEKRDKFQTAMEYQETQRERRESNRKEFMERQHQFGDMHLSGADLEKLMDFIKNPDMQKKIAERLAAKGVDKKSVAKGQAEMNEYIKLKEKEEKEGKQSLTAAELHRLQQINESKEFKVYAETSVKLAQDNGIDLSQNKTANVIAAATDDTSVGRFDAINNVTKLESGLPLSEQGEQTKASGFGMVASGRDVSATLASAPLLKSDFNNVVALSTAPSVTATFDPEMGADKTTKVNVAALSQKQIPAMSGDSFGASLG